jgi:hypothetical protein
MNQKSTVADDLYRWLLDRIEEEFRWADIGAAFGWAVSTKHAKRAARLAEADGLCLVVPNQGNGWCVCLTADPSRVIDGSLFLGAIENGVRQRRVLHDDFIAGHSRGSTDPDVRQMAKMRRHERQIADLLAAQHDELRADLIERRREARASNGDG